jgi:hypothetical protein
MLGDQPDNEIDNALLVPAIVVARGSLLLILYDATDLLGDEPHDGVDDSLLLEIVIAAITVAIVTAMIAVTVMAFSAPAVIVTRIALSEV